MMFFKSTEIRKRWKSKDEFQTNHELNFLELLSQNTTQRKQTVLMMSAACLVGWPSCIALWTNRFLKYLVNCPYLLGDPNTPAKRSGRMHIAESLSATAVFGFNPVATRNIELPLMWTAIVEHIHFNTSDSWLDSRWEKCKISIITNCYQEYRQHNVCQIIVSETFRYS